MSKTKPVVALCYDFDGTLIRGNMQENSFIPSLNKSPDEFWSEVKTLSKENDMDEVSAYMFHMIEEAHKASLKIDKNQLRKHGEKLDFFSGLDSWFDRVNQYADSNGLKAQHFVISSGIDEMIKGSPIAKNFEHIFASGFVYNDYGEPKFVARSLNYTLKTQYLFRINKDVHNSWDNKALNAYTPEEARKIPFSQMVYLGDGETDVPAMKMLMYQGGYPIVVYPEKKSSRRTKKEIAKKDEAMAIYNQNRCMACVEADFSPGKQLERLIQAILTKISAEKDINRLKTE